jgi:hypothetical protein
VKQRRTDYSGKRNAQILSLLTIIAASLSLALQGCSEGCRGGGDSSSSEQLTPTAVTPIPKTPPPTATFSLQSPTPTPIESTPGSGGGVQALWEQPDGALQPDIPPAVQTIRIVFESAAGPKCCVALNLARVPPGEQVVLTNLTLGPATLTIAGFSTDVAAAVPGITDECSTAPAGIAQACDPSAFLPPAFS